MVVSCLRQPGGLLSLQVIQSFFFYMVCCHRLVIAPDRVVHAKPNKLALVTLVTTVASKRKKLSQLSILQPVSARTRDSCGFRERNKLLTVKSVLNYTIGARVHPCAIRVPSLSRSAPSLTCNITLASDRCLIIYFPLE